MKKTIINNLRFVFFIFIFLVLAYSTLAQNGFRGTVVEVVDGKTVVIEMPTRSKVTTRIQFIEVPEPEQEFHGIVIEHLKKLVLGKEVTFKPRGITSTNSIVQLFVDGIDIGQQMLRDGAAWHAIPQISGQDADERAIYKNTEKLAKNEKRGIWSKDMLPAWEFRVYLEEKKKQEERTRSDALKAKALKEAERNTNRRLPETSTLTMDFNEGMWKNLALPETNSLGATPTTNGLLSGKIPHLKQAFLATVPNNVEMSGENLPSKVEVFVSYIYKEYDDPDPAAYLLMFTTQADEWKFLEENNLTVYADKKRISVGPAVRSFRMVGDRADELLMYRVERSFVEKLAKAGNLKFEVGNYSGKTSIDLQKSLKELLSMTNY